MKEQILYVITNENGKILTKINEEGTLTFLNETDFVAKENTEYTQIQFFDRAYSSISEDVMVYFKKTSIDNIVSFNVEVTFENLIELGEDYRFLNKKNCDERVMRCCECATGVMSYNPHILAPNMIIDYVDKFNPTELSIGYGREVFPIYKDGKYINNEWYTGTTKNPPYVISDGKKIFFYDIDDSDYRDSISDYCERVQEVKHYRGEHEFYITEYQQKCLDIKKDMLPATENKTFNV